MIDTAYNIPIAADKYKNRQPGPASTLNSSGTYRACTVRVRQEHLWVLEAHMAVKAYVKEAW